MEKRAVSFEVDATPVRGVLYLPGTSTPVPCVVLANGFSGTMDWIVPWFAERFVAAGLAALIFDYRHLGVSGGEPRQLIDLDRQRADLRAAIRFARQQPEIAAARVAVWGTSLGGSHAAVAAAEDPRIAAVVLNMPALDAAAGANLAAKRRALGMSRARIVRTALQLAAAGVSDAVRSALGRSPRYLAVYGEPGKALFTDPELATNFARVASQSPTWQNRVAARFVLNVPRYRPGLMERIKSPILVCLAERDLEVSAAFVTKKLARTSHSVIRAYPVGHFDMYHGETFEQVVADQTAFLCEHLAGAASPRTTRAA